MKNHKFENKKNKQDFNEWQDGDSKHHKMSSHRENKNWKNHLLDSNEEDEVDENFFHYDEDDEE